LKEYLTMMTPGKSQFGGVRWSYAGIAHKDDRSISLLLINRAWHRIKSFAAANPLGFPKVCRNDVIADLAVPTVSGVISIREDSR
jgi:hypothetical protein